MWKFTGQTRPEFAVVPEPGQESVWDYPRPPKLVPDRRLVEVYSGDRLVASSSKTYRLLETASPPTFYIAPEDINWKLLRAAPGSSVCEWKGVAKYWAMSDSNEEAVAWSYPEPKPPFEPIRNFLAFYPSPLTCTVAGERVRAQHGKFYGGWITREIVGPFKGDPGTESW